MTPRKRRLATPGSVLVYDGAPLEDADMRVLGPATVRVAPSVGASHPVNGDLEALRPDRVIPIPEGEERQETPPVSISCGNRGVISVVLWLEDAMLVVECKHLQLDSVLDCWVERTFTRAEADSAPMEEAG